MHTIALTLVVIQYYRCSKKIGVLNLSILLYFLCNLVWKHDNIWRQDIAIFFAYFAFFNLLETKRINKGVLVRIACFTVCGFLFHFSAILLIPIYLFLIWLMKIRFQFKYVFPFVFFITLLSSISGISVFLNLLGSVLSVFSSNLSSYYLNYLNNIDNDMTRFSLIWSGISTVPLFYFNYFNKETYEKNDFLRLCINLSWIVVTWRICFTHDILRRPTDYLL